MTPSLATLAFCPQADALMAGLASRAHQWTCWDMLQISSYEIEWAGAEVSRIIQNSGRTEVRIYGTEPGSVFTASISSQVSASRILSTLLLEKRGLGVLRVLGLIPEPSFISGATLSLGGGRQLKLQTLDMPTPVEDPWSLPPSKWSESFPGRPAQIEDIRYRNSKGFLGHLVTQSASE